MGNRRKVVLVCVLVAAGITDAAGAEEVPVIESVHVSQNRYVAADTLLYYVSTRTGDRFDELRLREDFRRLWDTGFLEDLVLDVKDGASGKIVTFLVRERPRILAVDYRGNKTLSTTAIQDALKEKDAALRVDTFYEPSRVKRVEEIVRDLLAEKGLPFARVTHEARAMGGGGVQVSFTVDEGIKARVRSVSFGGNTRFSDGDLRGVLKNLDRGPFWKLGWLKGPPVFSTDKWSDDEGDGSRLRTFLLDRGYVDAIVGEPVLRYSDGKSGRIRKRPVKWVDVEIPVMEGEQYRVGTVSFEGMTVFDPVRVRPLFKLETGDVYRESRLRKGYETLRELYGARGYFQWTGQTRRAPDPVRKTVDVVLAMEEDIRYYVGRILFTGNSQTRDKVIRREVYLNESEIFNTEALKLSIRRLNQLGYFKPLEGPPKIEPSTLGADHIDVTFAVEEQNRNQFTFGGGVSGLEGAYLNAGFQTANFLGLGETVGVTVQAGGRSAVYQLGITEPYLFDRPITAGVDVFSRRIDYVAQDNSLGWSEARAGASFTAGLPLGRFTRFFSGYTYEVIDTAVRDDLLDSDDAVSTGEPVFNPRRDEGRAIESRLTPTFVRNTVDNPFTPRSGMRLTASSALAGGFLGGSVDYIRPEIEGVLFWPVKKRMALGVRGNAGYILPFGSTAMVPYYQRLFLGGENQIRGVNARTVSPVSENGQALGGNKFMLFNAEYYFDIVGPLRFLLFFDAGEAYAEGQPLYWRTMRSSTGAELRFVMPVLNVPFRLIYALNPIRDAFQPASTFKFAVGTTF